MRKSPFIIVGLVILLAICSAPFLFGILAERQIKQFVQTISPNSDVKLALQTYNKGWFKSDVSFTVQINSSQIHRVVNQFTDHPLDPQIQSIVLNGTTTIFHGPIIFSKELSNNKMLTFGKAALVFNASLSSDSQKLLMNNFIGVFPTVAGTADIGFGNKINIALRTTPLNLQQKNTDNSARFSQMKGTWKVNLSDKFIDGSYEISGVGLSGNGMSLNAENIVASYQGEGEIFNITPHLGIMNETVKVPHAVVQQNQKTIFELNNGKLFNQSVLNDNKYDVTQIIELDKIIYQDKTYGPGRYIVVFKHIDPAAANQFIRQLNALKVAKTEKERNYLTLAGISSFVQFFTKGAELDLSFDLMTPEGPIAARSQANFNQQSGDVSSTAATTTNSANAPVGLDFIKKLKLNVEVKLPIALTENVFTSINEQYLEHQKATQKAATEKSQPNATTESNPAPLVNKSEEEIQQLAEQNTKQQLSQLINRGVLIESNGNYQMTIQLKDGEVLVNGKNIQNTQQTEPGVTASVPTSSAAVPQPVAPIMMLAPNAVKSTEQQSATATSTEPAVKNEPNPANQATTTTTTTPSTMKKTAVNQ